MHRFTYTVGSSSKVSSLSKGSEGLLARLQLRLAFILIVTSKSSHVIASFYVRGWSALFEHVNNVGPGLWPWTLKIPGFWIFPGRRRASAEFTLLPAAACGLALALPCSCPRSSWDAAAAPLPSLPRASRCSPRKEPPFGVLASHGGRQWELPPTDDRRSMVRV
jgi:hypothetical protein